MYAMQGIPQEMYSIQFNHMLYPIIVNNIIWGCRKQHVTLIQTSKNICTGVLYHNVHKMRLTISATQPQRILSSPPSSPKSPSNQQSFLFYPWNGLGRLHIYRSY